MTGRLRKDNVLAYALPNLVKQILDSDVSKEIMRYDAVLVDEGQDFLPNWWEVLRKICKPDGEMLLVADATQDIYETANPWTDDAMKGAGFRGGWAELAISYRLPKLAMEKAREFALQFLPEEKVDLPKREQQELDFERCDLRWVHTDESCAQEVCFEEVLRLSTTGSPETLAISDLTFLCDNKNLGMNLVVALGNKGIRTVHTYDPDEDECRRQKVGFYMGDARIKATTLHSFKGWESRALVIYVGSKVDQKTLALVYAGLTRLKRHVDGSCLTVVSCASELLEYGKTWPSFESRLPANIQF
jgi:hypothetical protein